MTAATPAYSDATAANEGGAYRFDAVDIEVGGSNYNVGWIRPGEFLNYSVDATAAGNVTLALRAANPEATTKAVRVSLDGVPAGQVLIAPTGGFLTYREFSASTPLALPAGRHVVTIAFEGVERLNFDWLSLATWVPTTTPTPTPTATVTPTATTVPEAPYPTAHVLPAKIEAEHFDAGGENVSYHDFEPQNLGNSNYRPGEGVDIETAGGVTDVCFVRAGEFLNYTVDATAADNVTLALRAANPEATTKAVKVSLDGVPAGQVLIAPTGGWTTYRDFAASAPLTIPEGRHVVTIAFEGVERLNFDWLSLATWVPTTSPTPTPTATTPTPTATVTVTPTGTWTPGPDSPLAVTGLDLVNEWVSIRNAGDAAVNLSGCTLSNAGSTRVYTFPSFELGAGATVTVRSAGGTNSPTDLYWGIGPVVWNDYRDTATLKRPDGAVISSLTRVTWA